MLTTAACVFGGYLAFFIGLSLWRRGRTERGDAFAEFAVAGRSQSATAVALSLVATIVGGSATFGAAELAYAKGAVAALWLGVGAVGLVLQALFLARLARGLACHSLPEAAGRLAGRAGQRLLACIIALAWLGVIAAQFSGLGKILTAMFPAAAGDSAWITAAGLAVIAYTCCGGQRAIIKTDGVQAAWLFAALAAALAWLFLRTSPPPALPFRESLVLGDWTAWDTARLAILVGGAYFVGPDMFSRSCSARDGDTARRACLLAAAGILAAAAAVTLVGLWARWNVPAEAMRAAGNSPFAYLLGGALPPALTWVLALGLAGALLSSADTCLLGVAVIIEVDIFGRARTGWTRVWLAGIGGAALLLALRGEGILRLLLQSYAVYVPAAVGPVAVALLAGRRLRRGRWLAAVLAGGTGGLAGEILGSAGWLADPWARPGLALAGTAASVILALWSLRFKI